MRTIFKQVLNVTGEQTIMLQKDAVILHLDNQNEHVCLWYECDTDMPTVPIKVRCFGTGHEMPKDIPLEYIGTVLVLDGRGVFHFYKQN